MAEEATLKWSELKKSLQAADQKELINLLHDLYKNSVENRRFITARYAKKEDESKILEAYRKKVINVYYHPRGAASQPRYSVAKKAINDYYEASGDIKGTMDLALTLVENIMRYLHEFSGIDESSYAGGSDMIEKFCELARTEERLKFYPYFRERLQKLYRDSEDSPYGIGDNLRYYISNLVDDISYPEDDFFKEDVRTADSQSFPFYFGSRLSFILQVSFSGFILFFKFETSNQYHLNKRVILKMITDLNIFFDIYSPA